MKGRFGHSDCMGKVRSYPFDAVIGVGGKKPWYNDKDIALKINWVGIYAIKVPPLALVSKGPLVTFKHFILLEGAGPELKSLAPQLFRYMFLDGHRRHVMSRSLPDHMQREVQKILQWARKLHSKGQKGRNKLKHSPCHPERSEGSPCSRSRTKRDSSLRSE